LLNCQILIIKSGPEGESAHQWGFAINQASHDDYEDSHLPNGYLIFTGKDAHDAARRLHLNDPTAWT
jgi:hypothetical protein